MVVYVQIFLKYQLNVRMQSHLVLNTGGYILWMLRPETCNFFDLFIMLRKSHKKH